jgi:hypothetical protein
LQTLYRALSVHTKHTQKPTLNTPEFVIVKGTATIDLEYRVKYGFQSPHNDSFFNEANEAAS